MDIFLSQRGITVLISHLFTYVLMEGRRGDQHYAVNASQSYKNIICSAEFFCILFLFCFHFCSIHWPIIIMIF